MLVAVENVSKGFASHEVLKNISLKIEDRDRIGLIGANGAGKSTLLRLINGKDRPDEGTVAVTNRITVGFLEQNSGLDRESTISAEMHKVFQPVLDLEREMREIEAQMSCMESVSEEYKRLSDRYAMLEERFQKSDGYLIEVKIKTILNGMGFGDKAFDTVIGTLSGGEKTRLAIARLLLEQPDLLILDEPTNHLDFRTLMWLEGYLKDYRGALLLVSHDRYFLDRLVDSICEIERGKLTRYKGNYTKFVELKEEQRQRQQKEYELQQQEIAALEDYVARNMVRASTAKSARSRQNTLDKMERIERPGGEQKPPKIRFSFERQPVKDVLHVRDLELAVGQGEKRKILAHSLSLDMLRGEKIALIGVNGVGKSSLLKAILGKIPAPKGVIEWGKHCKVAYYDQENALLDPENTALEELWRRHPLSTEQEIRSRLGAVLLTGENVYKKVGNLSGGERAKLAFAVLIYEEGNVLILDEPTNHMDLSTKEVIDQALSEFEGTILMVSHDRYLLNRVPTKIIEMFPDSVQVYDGNFDYYQERSAWLAAREKEQKELLPKTGGEGQAQYYRSKQQRSEEAQRRRRLQELESFIGEHEQAIARLEGEIASSEIASDYSLLKEKCDELELLREELTAFSDEWLELSV